MNNKLFSKYREIFNSLNDSEKELLSQIYFCKTYKTLRDDYDCSCIDDLTDYKEKCLLTDLTISPLLDKDSFEPRQLISFIATVNLGHFPLDEKNVDELINFRDRLKLASFCRQLTFATSLDGMKSTYSIDEDGIDSLNNLVYSSKYYQNHFDTYSLILKAKVAYIKQQTSACITEKFNELIKAKNVKPKILDNMFDNLNR